MTYITASARVANSRPTLSGRLARLLGVWRQRQTLGRLDTNALRDIGLTRTQAEKEARRPIWDAPDRWIR